MRDLKKVQSLITYIYEEDPAAGVYRPAVSASGPASGVSATSSPGLFDPATPADVAEFLLTQSPSTRGAFLPDPDVTTTALSNYSQPTTSAGEDISAPPKERSTITTEVCFALYM